MAIDIARGTGTDPGGEPPVGAVGAAHVAIDAVAHELDALGGGTGVSPSQMAAVLREMTRLVNRAQALRDKAAAIAARAEVAERVGSRSTGHWLARVTSTDPRAAQRQARRAEVAGLAAPAPASGAPIAPVGLVVVGAGPEPADDSASASSPPASSPAEEPAPLLTLTGQAQLAGDLSTEQVDIITGCLISLPDGTTPTVRLACERELIRVAAGRSPRDLRRLAARVLERVGQPEQVADAHENSQAVAAEDSAWERASFWIKDNDDGTMHGQFTVPTLAGLTLKKILDAMASPRRRQRATLSSRDHGGPAAHAGASRGSAVLAAPVGTIDGAADAERPAGDSSDAGRSWKERSLARQQRQGQDFATLLRHLPTDHLHDKTAATVIVTTRLADLQDALASEAGSEDRGEDRGEHRERAGAAPARVGSTDTGHSLSAGEVRQTACEAGIIPAVLGTDAQPLDLGRQTRFFTATQRAALAMTHDTCAVDDCDIPFAWTETHHHRRYEHGGRTDLDNAIPLCGRHHRLLDRGFSYRTRREGRRIVVELARRRT